MSLRRSFKATIAERVMRLSPIPAASLPSVVPEHGQITTASMGADPDADFAPMFACSSKIAPVSSLPERMHTALGDMEHVSRQS